MIDLILVEDEPFIRQSIMRLLETSESIRVAGEASNGEEALEKLKSHSCQVVLTDIRMPVMNGIELICEIRRRSVSCACIVLSAYNDFVLVKEAFKAGACEYILKSDMNRESLEQAVIQASAKLSREQDQQILLRQSWLSHKSRSGENPDPEELDRFFPERDYSESILLGVLIGPDQMELPDFPCRALLTEWFYLKPGKWGVLISRSNLECWKEMSIPDTDSSGIWFSLGLSLEQKWYSLFPESIAAASAAASCYFLYGRNRCIYSSRIPDTEPNEGAFISQLEHQFDQWQAILKKKEWKDLSSIYGNCSIKEKKYHPDLYPLIRRYFIDIKDSLKKVLPDYCEGKPTPGNLFSLGTLGELNCWFYDTLHSLVESSTLHPQVRKAKKLIDRDPRSNISLGDISSELNLNASYFSRLFHHEMGVGFASYVNRQKINLAIELIENENCRIFEAAELSGFSSSDHFSRMFKKIKGISPREYFK